MAQEFGTEGARQLTLEVQIGVGAFDVELGLAGIRVFFPARGKRDGRAVAYLLPSCRRVIAGVVVGGQCGRCGTDDAASNRTYRGGLQRAETRAGIGQLPPRGQRDLGRGRQLAAQLHLGERSGGGRSLLTDSGGAQVALEVGASAVQLVAAKSAGPIIS